MKELLDYKVQRRVKQAAFDRAGIDPPFPLSIFEGDTGMLEVRFGRFEFRQFVCVFDTTGMTEEEVIDHITSEILEFLGTN